MIRRVQPSASPAKGCPHGEWRLEATGEAPAGQRPEADRFPLLRSGLGGLLLLPESIRGCFFLWVQRHAGLDEASNYKNKITAYAKRLLAKPKVFSTLFPCVHGYDGGNRFQRMVAGLALVFCCGISTPVFGEPVILAFGDSLTAGYMVGKQQSYPARLQEILQAKGYPYKVVNAGVTGDTTAGGVRRIDWVLKHQPKIVILELGANDGLRGLSVTAMEANLETIIEICQANHAQVLLAGMKALPNYGKEYNQEFEAVFSRLAEKYNLPLIPFFLVNVAGIQKLTRPDGLHPVAEGYEIVTQTVWQYLEPMLKK